MDEKHPKKTGAQSEQDLIKSALSTDLDESTVDIFAQDLFAPAEPKKEKAQAPEPKPVAPEPKPAEAEELGPSLSRQDEVKPEPAEKIETTEPERVKPELSWEKPPAGQTGEQTRLSASAKSAPTPKPRQKSAPEMDLKIEAGEFHSVAAVKEEEKVDQTGEILSQLEKMGEDYLSSQEMKKLFQNVNLMIDLINKALVRMEQLERKLKEKGIL